MKMATTRQVQTDEVNNLAGRVRTLQSRAARHIVDGTSPVLGGADPAIAAVQQQLVTNCMVTDGSLAERIIEHFELFGADSVVDPAFPLGDPRRIAYRTGDPRRVVAPATSTRPTGDPVYPVGDPRHVAVPTTP